MPVYDTNDRDKMKRVPYETLQTFNFNQMKETNFNSSIPGKLLNRNKLQSNLHGIKNLFITWKGLLIISCLSVFLILQSCENRGSQNQLKTDPFPEVPEHVERIETVSVGNNREFLINDTPFFPIMSWAQPVKNYRLLDSLGFNTHAGNADPEAAREVGCYAIPGYKPDRQDNGYIMALIFDDEPDMPSGKGEEAKPRQTPEQVAEKMKTIRGSFPEKLVFMTFTGHFTVEQSTYPGEVRKSLYPQYVKMPDVVGFDIYPIYGSGYAAHLNWVGSGVSQLRELAGNKPVYAWIETSKGSRWMSYEKQPDVLPIHTRNEVWQAIINGATAIGYFTHAWEPSFIEFAPTEMMRAELKRLNHQISRLSPAILAAPAKENISMKLGDDLYCQFKATNYNSELFIFALNSDLGDGAEHAKQFDPISPRKGKAFFTVEGLKAGTPIEVIDENRTITAENDSFSDDFEPLAEHVYRIKINR